MTLWVIMNVFTSALVASIIAFKLGAWPDQFNMGERIGMGSIGCAMVLRIGPLISDHLLHLRDPFEDWSTLLLNVGLCCYFLGRMVRHIHGFGQRVK